MMMITKLVGTPGEDLIKQIEDPDNQVFMRQLKPDKGKDFNELFKGYSNPDAIDLIKKMLTFDPESRITID